MQRPLDNQHVIEIKPLPSPRTIKSKLPITDQAAALVVETRDAIRRILHGQDRDRLLVIVGPCSIHDPEAAYEYADRLKPVADALRDRLLIVMRTYFEKPRTTVGWKGLINDPHLDGTCDIATGMELARTILLNINNRGMPCAAEALDPVSSPIHRRSLELDRHRCPHHRKPAAPGNGQRALYAGRLQERHRRQSSSGLECHGRREAASSFSRHQCRWAHVDHQDHGQP